MYIDFNDSSFEDATFFMTISIETTLSNYIKIFNVKTLEELDVTLKLKDLPSNTICAKRLNSIGAWRCIDCIRNDKAVFCQDCWSLMKDKHINHNILFVNDVNSICGCGDYNCINPKYFCKDHLGMEENEKKINDYIKKCLGDDIPNRLRIDSAKIFEDMMNYFVKAIKEGCLKTATFQNVVAGFVNTFGYLCERNSACTHIFTELLLRKYYSKVQHKCLEITDTGGQIIKYSVFKHECKCHFIRYLLKFWPAKKENVLIKLIQNHKLKRVIGLFYFLFYGDYIKNGIDEFESANIKVICDDVLKVACNIDGLLENIYESMIEILDFFRNDLLFVPNCLLKNSIIDLGKKKYELLSDIICQLKADSISIVKPVSFYYLSNNAIIIFKLIDLMSEFHNINPVESDTFSLLPKGSKFIIELLDIELWILDIFALFVSIFNFNDVNLVKDVFTYFSKIIRKEKHSLSSKEYSIHITLYRGFSIFLNRYCFHEANKNNTNIFASLQTAAKLIPDFKKCSKLMIKSIYKVFGFVTGCGETLFDTYGTEMRQYEYLYYYNYEFIYRDFCLLKYLLSMKENAKYLEFRTIMDLSKFDNSYEIVEEFLSKGSEGVNTAKNESAKIFIKFSSKILFVILSVFRNNTCLIWNLSSGYKLLKINKLKDQLIIDIFTKDINNFLELTNELVINQVLIKENSALYTEISDKIFGTLKDYFGEKYINDIIISLTNQTLTQEKKAKFSLKDELLFCLDLNYILYPIHKSTVEKYIFDFKSNKISIFNIHFYPVNKFELKLTEEDYIQLYFNEKNFNFIFQYTSSILTKKGNEILNENFLSILLNYISTFLCLDFERFNFLRENLDITHIIQVLEKNNLNDEVKKSYCKFIVDKFKEKKITSSSKATSDLFGFIDVSEIKETKENIINEIKPIQPQEPKKNENNVKPVEKKSKNSLKEKMKNKFKKKNIDLGGKLGIDKIKVEEKKNCESCIICLKPIETDDITKPYGAVGDYVLDNLISNAFFRGLREEYDKLFEKDKSLEPFDKLYFQTSNRGTIKIISCNHLLHFTCYFKQFMESNLLKSLSVFSCPLCHRLNEAYIPMIDQYTYAQTFDYLKPFSFNYVIEYGRKHIEEYEKSIPLKEDNKEEKDEEKKDEEKEVVKEEEKKEENKEEKKEEDEPQKIKENQVNDDFRKKYPDFVNSCKHFIEGFVGIKSNVSSLDIENDILKPIISKYSTVFGIEFKDFISYLDNIENKQFNIHLWRNFSLSLRLMLKLNIVTKEKYFCQLYKLIKQCLSIQFDFSIDNLIQINRIKIITCEILFLLTVFFEYEEIEGYEKYILYYTMPIYAFGFFLKEIYLKTSLKFNKDVFSENLTPDNLDKFLKENTSLNNIMILLMKQLLITKLIMIKDIDANKLSFELNDNIDLLNLSSLKNKTFEETLEELDKLIEADTLNNKKKTLYENFMPIYKYKEVFKLILNEHIELCQTKGLDKIIAPGLLHSCYPSIVKFIKLPELAIDFEYESYNKECQICKKKGQISLICLVCGTKICDSRGCIALLDGEEIICFYAHTKLCGGGRSAYLQTDDCSVLFVSHKAVFKKFVPLYTNELGEGITKSDFGKEFKLNKEEVKKVVKMFNEYSYSNAEIIT